SSVCSIISLQVFYNSVDVFSYDAHIGSRFSFRISQAIRVQWAGQPDGMASSPTSLHDRFKCFGRNRLLHKYGLYLMFDDERYQLGNVAKPWLTEGRQSLEPFYFYPISLTEIGEGIVSGNKNLALFRDAARSEEHTSELQSRENLVCR